MQSSPIMRIRQLPLLNVLVLLDELTELRELLPRDLVLH